MMNEIKILRSTISECQVCKQHLPFPPKPIIQLGDKSRIMIIGQAPGLKAHESGIPWDDNSGDRLRSWLQVDKADFYHPDYFTLMPMGFCFPGYKNKADAPPRPECAPKWHGRIQAEIKPELIIIIGRYAQKHYLPNFKNLTTAIKEHNTPSQNSWVLPHPSGRNNRWFSQHPWFEDEQLPHLQRLVQRLLR